MIFPLPLTEFEHYMLADDRPAHPMVFYLRLRFDGELQREALERSVEVARSRHPLLDALVETRGRKTYFVASEEQRPIIRWEGDPELDVVQSAEHLDIHKEIGLRVTVCQAEGQASLWLAFHHVCCDGLGAMRFAEDLLIAYASEASGAKLPLPDLNEKQLLDRDVFASSRIIQWLRWPLEVLSMVGSVEYFTHRPLPLRVSGVEVASDPESPTLASCSQTLDGEQLSQLLQVARDENVTLNDLLLRDCFKAGQQWLDANNSELSQGHLRIIVPMSLRTRLHQQMPAANCVGMVNVDRRVHRWHDSRRMLQVLGWEMRIIKRLCLAVTMLRIAKLVRLVTGKLQWLQPTDRCLTTCVLSNLGVVFRDGPMADKNGCVRVGNVALEQIEALPPVRPLTGAAIGVTSYAGRLTFSMLYDSRLLGPSGGKELLDQLVSQLKDSVQRGLRIADSREMDSGNSMATGSATAPELPG